jgi:hypothetical protein
MFDDWYPQIPGDRGRPGPMLWLVCALIAIAFGSVAVWVWIRR